MVIGAERRRGIDLGWVVWLPTAICLSAHGMSIDGNGNFGSETSAEAAKLPGLTHRSQLYQLAPPLSWALRNEQLLGDGSNSTRNLRVLNGRVGSSRMVAQGCSVQ